MNVAIYGAGGMGTVLGAYITKAGYEIDLINRNKDHIKVLKAKGAKIIGKVNLTQKVTALLPEEMTKKYDIILLMTKQRFNKEIVEFLVPFLSEDGVICTMQNGLPELSVANIIGDDRTIGCTMSWGATFLGKGVVELTSEPSRDVLTYSIGMYGENDQKHFDHIVELLDTMGDVKIENNFVGARWSKLLVNAAFSGLSVVTNARFGVITKNKKTRLLALKAIKECIDVAKASNITIEPIQGKDVVKLMDYNNKFRRSISMFIIPIAMRKHKQIKSSMLRDIERNKKTEVYAINGVVCEHGDKVNIDTPINDMIVSIVEKIENKELEPCWDNLKYFDKFKG
ncbi:2-dehydropantoate 2-reductase [Candidatus Izimaplasma bacterium HR1]|jgi:2-dehydropantoate 2-reductase|uniref:ketopantoate reductase family protein n=1 Tax=Candidatus Izimoplasma sp. HR1 TaxID=1541959 RepID=UPI0004F80453|nr:2-dehydropantoate 2-reductase [Candidatus Izimaplasma bacterium HR1]